MRKPAASDFLLPVIRYLPLAIVIFSLRRFRRPRRSINRED